MTEIQLLVAIAVGVLTIIGVGVKLTLSFAKTRRDSASALELAKSALALAQQHSVQIAVLEARQAEILSCVKYIKQHMFTLKDARNK